MTHLVITGSKDGENVTWKDKVSDEEYLSGYRQTQQTDAAIQALSAQRQAIKAVLPEQAQTVVER